MIAKGNLHAHGVKLASYLMTGHPGERAELIGMRGFGPVSDLRDGFRVQQIVAHDGTKAEQPFFHAQFRSVGGEGANKLTRADWLAIADRCDVALGRVMTQQPRAVSLHIDRQTGDMHMHLGYSLVRETDDGRFFVQKLGLYKVKLQDLAREIEKDYGLTIIGNERNGATAANRREFEESRRLGTDIKEIRNAILDGLQKSDNGKSFAAAMAGQGYELANGDRRDCLVVIDHAGGQHALNKKLTGLTSAAIRDRLGDLDRAALPSVEQAQEMQAQRAAQERGKHGRAVDGAGQGITLSDGPQRTPEIKPLGKTAGEIRLAWSLTRNGEQFVQAIEDRGVIFVHVSREEAEASQRSHAFAKAINRQNRALKEGFAVVDQRGNVTRIDQRTTGDQWEEIQKRLGGIDPADLLSVDAAREVMKEANRAAWAEQQRSKRESERPASEIETTIADALKTTMTGHEFAAALDKAGLTITRATAGDVQALDALRRDDQLAASSGLEATGRYYARLEIGDVAAVTRAGDVFQLSPHKLDLVEIEQRLGDVQPRMASVTEARAFNQITREQAAERWADRRAENAARSFAYFEAQNGDREVRGGAASVQQAKQETIAAVEQIADKGERAVTRILGGIGGMVGKAAEAVVNMFAPPPPPTKEQVRLQQRAEAEAAPVREVVRSEAEREARLRELLQQDARSRALRREFGQEHDHDDDRGRERER